MAQKGHADDCPACRYDELPDADKAALDASAFTLHTRRPPPVEPQDSNKGILLIFAGAVFTVSGFTGSSHDNYATGSRLAFVVLAVFGGIALLAGLVIRSRFRKELRTARTQWRQAFEAWKAEQTQVWLQHRSRAELWPCPTCGDLSCSNQHSSTTTYRTGHRRYDSFTDPR